MNNDSQSLLMAGSSPPAFPKKNGLALAFLVVGALIAVFLAGGPTEGGMGVFLCVAGVVLLLVGPSQTPPGILWILGGILIAAACTSLFPQEWLGNPGVRAGIRQLPMLSLPVSISLDPRTTIFWIILLSLSVLIALYCIASPLSVKQMEYLALIAVLGCSLYAILALKAWQTGWKYPFFEKPSWTQPAFGFFPNRNHTADFLITGAILSLGLIHRGVSGRGLLIPITAACSFALLVSVLLFNSISRAGLIFLPIGCVIWFVGLGRERSRPLILGSAAIVLVLLMLFLSSGSILLDRVTGHSPTDDHISKQMNTEKDGLRGMSSLNDMRLKIWSDTVSIIAGYPITGTGLGTYAVVYPFYADKSLRDQSTALHAESDWVTLCAESGVPTLLIVSLILAFLISRIPCMAVRSGREWPVRWAFITAFLTAVLHGFIDVPLHKPELGWWVLLLGGIGFGERIQLGESGGRSMQLCLQRIVFALGGLGALCMGSMMIHAQWGGGPPMPPFAPALIQKKIVELYGKGDPASAKKAIEEARRAILLYPMAHQLYYQLAEMILVSEKNVPESIQLLEAEQAVSPNDPDFVFVAGWLLAGDAPMSTATFWNEALRRQLAYDNSPNSAIHRTGDLYEQMLGVAWGNWPLFDRLPAIATNKEMRMIWLTQQYCNAAITAEAVRDDSFMKKLSEKQQAQLIKLWWQRGDKKEVEDFIARHSQYQQAALPTLVASLVAYGKGEQACRLLVNNFQIPATELTYPLPSTIHSADGTVPDESLEAAKYYWKLGNSVAALHDLDDAMSGPARSEALRFRAMLEMRAGKWSEALADLTAYLQSIGRL